MDEVSKILPDEIYQRMCNDLEDNDVKATPETAARFIKRCMIEDISANGYDEETLVPVINEYLDDYEACIKALDAKEDDVKISHHPMACNNLVIWRNYND